MAEKSQELLDAVCDGIATGKSARKMCIELSIPRKQLWEWLNEDESFKSQYAHAREEQADFYADEIVEISDDGKRDYVVDADGNKIVDQDHIQRSRLRVDARKWYASKVAPKKYGDKLELSGDPDRPIAVLDYAAGVAAAQAKAGVNGGK